MIKPTVSIFNTPYELAEKAAENLTCLINDAGAERRHISVVLSGGSTPNLMYSLLGDHFARSADWNWVHFFWGDERCVPPIDESSNFREANNRFFTKAGINEQNIHRIMGENDPAEEAIRYSCEILANTTARNGFPLFDLILLGVGEDGHTASIFPGSEHLLVSDRICEVTSHPVSGQKRITLTGRVLNNARSVMFMVAGRNKAEIVRNLLIKSPGKKLLPAALVTPEEGEVKWFLDREAASLLQ